MKAMTSRIPRSAGQQALVQELRAERRADLLARHSLIGNGSEPNFRIVTRLFASFGGEPADAARRDLDLAVGDRALDERRRDDGPVEDDREELADVLGGVVGEELRALALEDEVDGQAAAAGSGRASRTGSGRR